MNEQTTTTKTERPHRKVRRGYVLSDKMDKTVVVEVEERYTHSLYGKVLRRSKKVKVHDEHNEAHPLKSIILCRLEIMKTEEATTSYLPAASPAKMPSQAVLRISAVKPPALAMARIISGQNPTISF